MRKPDTPSRTSGSLRKKAEAALKTLRVPTQKMSPDEIRQLVYELQVHEIELEMQNEELRRTHLKLEISRDRYATLFDFSPVGYAVLDEQGLIREANLTLCHLLGQTRGKVLKQSFQRFVDAEDQKEYREFLESLRKKAGNQPSGVLTLGAADSSHRVRLEGGWETVDPLLGTAEGRFRIAVEDVTIAERMESARQEQQALFRLVMEGVTDAIVTIGDDQRIVMFNKGAEVMFRCPVSKAVGQPLDRFIPQRYRHDHDGHIRQFGQSAEGSRQMGLARDVRGLRADGDEFPAEVTISKVEVLDREKGKGKGKGKGKKLFTAVIRDITERRKAEEALDRERQFLSTVFDTTAGLLIVTDPQGHVIRFNRACEVLTGFSCEEVLGRPWWEKLLPSGDPQEVKKYFQALVQGWVPTTYENYWIAKDGGLRWVVWSNALIRNNEGAVTYVIGTGIDMTESRDSQQKIVELALQNTSILQSAKEGIYGVDRDWRCMFFNRSAEGLTEYEASEVLGRVPHDLLHHTKPDGIPYPREECPVWRTLREGSSSSLDDEVIWRKDGTSFPAEYSTTPIRNDAGGVEGAVVTFRDITERKETEEVLQNSRLTLERQQAELQSLTAKLLTAQEEERQRVSRDLHDDVNQRLALLSFKLQSAQQKLPESHPSRQALSDLDQDVAKLSDDVRHLAYQYHPSILDDLGLEPALRSLIKDFADWESVPVTLQASHVPSTLPPEVASCLYRVAQEGLRNIFKHAQASNVQLELRGEPHGLTLSLHDDGQGFQAHESRSGGLGLVSMRERVLLVNGSLRMESRPGQGTTVWVWVPLGVSKP